MGISRQIALRSTAAVSVTLLATAGLAPMSSGASVRGFKASDDIQVQYAGALKVPATTRVVDVDGDGTSPATVKSLHAKGKVVVCYISAGSVESYRTDANKFPKSVVGKTLAGWPDEKWLDIRQLQVLLPIMKDRIARCKAKGFDAMDFDNVDAYTNDSGFPLIANDQIRYNRSLAALAHRAGLRAVLKNAVSIIPRLVDTFDAALNEQCGQYNECGVYRPFVKAHKPVWVLEYDLPMSRACVAVTRFGLHVQRKHLNLDAWRQPCPAPRG